MMPGISARPSASMVSFALPSTPATPVMRPSLTARLPRTGAEPSPSSRSALRIRRSCTDTEYTFPMEEFRLQGKVAIVTGGANGIGAATVRLIQKAGGTAISLDIATGCDVTDEKAVARSLVDAEKQHGGIDILVNNAGRAARKPAV